MMLSQSFLAFALSGVIATAAAKALVSVTGQPSVAAWRPGATPSVQNVQKVSYTGDGLSFHGWPSREVWTTFDDMWNRNVGNIGNSCPGLGVNQPNTPDDTINLHDGILLVANESFVDSRFILAIVLQESGGCVRVPTTNNGVRNPGLMQSHNGASCNDPQANPPINPDNDCSKDTIVNMIRDGTSGTPDGDGLSACINEQSVGVIDDDATQAFFRAARCYNSGSVNQDDLNDGRGSTNDYVNDVANRVMGVTTI